MKLVKPLFNILVAIIAALNLNAQPANDSVHEKFVFTKVFDLPATPVKDQSASGTCWSYATTSFLESELLRTTNDTFDLSEMYFVRKTYEDKSKRYMRLHGKANYGQGGQAHDVINVFRTYGLITESAYSGLANGQTKPSHTELETLLAAMVEALAKNPGGKLSPDWTKAISGVLDVYLGKVPETFGDKGYTPLEFASSLPLKPDDYIEITSYTHHPFYVAFPLEIPDNWSEGSYFNVPLDDLIEIMDYSLKNGFTVVWDCDISDKGFSHQNGVAVLPEPELDKIGDTERSKWDKLSEKERKQQFFAFVKPVPEKQVTPEMRQAAFDNYATTDDHLMHITGTFTDQDGRRYFHTKNSWAAESNSFGGYINISEAYVRLNTIAIMVHSNGIPREIRKKRGLK